MSIHYVGISSFDEVGWLVQVSLTLFAFTLSIGIALPVNAKSVRKFQQCVNKIHCKKRGGGGGEGGRGSS